MQLGVSHSTSYLHNLGFQPFFPYLFREITCNLPLNFTSIPLSPRVLAISSSSFFFPCSISSVPACGSQTQRSGNGAPQRGLAAQAVRRAHQAEWRAPGRQACSWYRVYNCHHPPLGNRHGSLIHGVWMKRILLPPLVCKPQSPLHDPPPFSLLVTFPELSGGHVSLRATSSISLTVYTDFVPNLKNYNGSSVPSPVNLSSVIIYSSSSLSKHVWLSFFCRTQKKRYFKGQWCSKHWPLLTFIVWEKKH